ncbi:mitochondrial lysine-tRNA synthetase [Batrachochytrium dendrobatidis]|nr:mitochondrial lysine-tRNA synthetase [Batrachochytrium dendrobatidis]
MMSCRTTTQFLKNHIINRRLLINSFKYQCLFIINQSYSTLSNKNHSALHDQTHLNGDQVHYAMKLKSLANLTEPIYPSTVSSSNLYSQSEFIAEFDSICQSGMWLDESHTSAIVGRIVLRRDASKNLIFLVIERDGIQVQAVMNKQHWPSTFGENHFQILSGAIGLGDIIYVKGVPGRTKSGQLSIRATCLKMLSPCLHIYPKKHVLLEDENIRYRQRYLDMLVHRSTVDLFLKRSKIIRTIRSFFDTREFVEIETPVLSLMAGGANAKPFTTRMDVMNLDLQMRIAPELYLKQLVIGGIGRVYEIGKQFRNEGIDKTHNPEFTTCEFYMAYGTFDQAMELTENLFRDVATKVNGSTIVEWETADGQIHQIDFSQPFKRIEIIPELEKALGVTLPNVNDQSSMETLLQLCNERNIVVQKPFTLPRILDKLISELIEPKCIDPTFVVGHPVCMSPLAKSGENPELADRFELFVGTKELANAYMELNDPAEQRRRFASQRMARDQGDVEAQPMDESFCLALEYALPPTVGWGLGIDRFCMLMTGTKRIKELIAFPILKPLEHTTEPSVNQPK